jgi:DNA-binding transcriptional ArsR family regulator
MSAKIYAFLKQIESGQLQTMRAKVYHRIRLNQSISTYSLRMYLGAHQSVTSALSSLENDGLIRKSGEVLLGKHMYSQWVAHTNVDGIIAHAEHVNQRKKHLWVKRAFESGWIDNQVATFLQKYLKNELHFDDTYND